MPHTAVNQFVPHIESYAETFAYIPITSQEHLILTHRGCNYYLIDLKIADWNRIRNIINACEEVEQECWKAQENFSDYLQKHDVLSYVEKDGKVIGFDVVSLLRIGDTCIYSNDETMVRNAFRGQNLARNLVFATSRWFLSQTTRLTGVRSIAFLSISANPKVVNGYFKNAYTRILFDCSFQPSSDLIAIKEAYCAINNLSSVHPDYPFCLKEVFPGSAVHTADDPRCRFSAKVKAKMPPDFDHIVRGDAFAFMVKIPKPVAHLMVLILMGVCFGRTFFTRHRVGLFSPRRQCV